MAKTYMAFLDFKKAFDNVKWNELFKTLKKIGLKYKVIIDHYIVILIINFYRNKWL